MGNGAIIGLFIGLVLLIVLIVLIWWISTSNNIKRMGVKIDEAESGIDVALTKRYDMLTKTIATVKGYAKHEEETLTKIIAMRQPAQGASMEEKSKFAGEMNKAFDSINVVMEQYPDLKASKNFENLQNQIYDVEEQLQAARRVYNSNVSTFNQMIIAFPTSVVANKMKVTKRAFFEAEESKKADVKVEF